MKLGPKQLAWVAEEGFPNGAITLRIGPILILVRLPKRWRRGDPSQWSDGIAAAPTLNPDWAAGRDAAQVGS